MKTISKVLSILPLLLFLAGCGSDNADNQQQEILEEGIEYVIPDVISGYYSEVDFNSGSEELLEDLAVLTISKHSRFLEYYERHNYLYEADEDPGNSSNVILIYSGESHNKSEYWSSSNPNENQTFNTEHIYPRSMVNNTALADLHHLRTADAEINESRSNFPFTDGQGTYKLVGGNTFFPGEEWRGDVARMIMYMNLRYEEPFSDMGGLALFLKWNAEDPLSPIEIQRNEVIANAQGNRNPFIDNPNLATRIWGGQEAANRWNGQAVEEEEVPNEETSTVAVLFSEYVEGTRYNKALEIVNLSGQEIELSAFSLMKITNAEKEWKNEYQLEGTVANKEVYVIVHEEALEEMQNAADVSTNHQIVNFNGNDPIGLFHDGKLIDMIGNTGGEDFAKDVTLRRKPAVSTPNSSFSSGEWETLQKDAVDGLGTY